eukprot:scaffold7226_cov387-Prasinococcus_capsulatus_cf.AAC.13
MSSSLRLKVPYYATATARHVGSAPTQHCGVPGNILPPCRRARRHPTRPSVRSCVHFQRGGGRSASTRGSAPAPRGAGRIGTSVRMRISVRACACICCPAGARRGAAATCQTLILKTTNNLT